MDETHVCVLDREGMVVRERKTASTAEAIANVDSELSCPVLVARELSAASGFVPVGMWAGRSAVHISTGPRAAERI
jgi:hypothetical protein